ncbi:MAG: hypothetical protein ACSLFB_12835 [Acidimicrobiales bacterium]
MPRMQQYAIEFKDQAVISRERGAMPAVGSITNGVRVDVSNVAEALDTLEGPAHR